jgi:hypothetical protein
MRRDGRTGLRRRAADLAMGARFAVSGGREGWVRTVLTAVGVGLGVAVLLVAASVPHMASARDARSDARQGVGQAESDHRTEHSVLMLRTDTSYHGRDFLGRLLLSVGDDPTRPPGVDELPAPGTMLVSPALKRLLGSDDDALLRERLPYRIAGTVGDAGLTGPRELVYYAGTDRLTARDAGDPGGAVRVGRFGDAGLDTPLDPELILLVVVLCVVLLLPVAAFIAAAVRFGGERRDRRLAALRLVGADAHMTRRAAAGEAATGALLGLAVGVALFLPLKWSAAGIAPGGVSVFPSDVQPAPALLVLIALGVPGCAVGVSLLALRGVVIEPLGVVRRAVPRRRRLWWRLVPTVAGAALLAPTIGGLRAPDARVPTSQMAAGMVLVLVGVTAVLPWSVEAVVRRIRAGAVPLQLAVRRLQLDSGTASRAVSGITVAVAGAVALQLLFSAVETGQTEATGQDPSRARMVVSDLAPRGDRARAMTERVASAPGVRRALGITNEYAGIGSGGVVRLQVADSATLRELARIGVCHAGDVFVVPGGRGGPRPAPGSRLDLSGPHLLRAGAPDTAPEPWRVPRDARTVRTRTSPLGRPSYGVLATPAAVDVTRLYDADVQVLVQLDPEVPDAEEYVRNAGAALGPATYVYRLRGHDVSHQFAVIERALYAGATGVLLLIGASMVVSTLEQLRERRRLLSVLVAVGTRRATLAWSVLWQTALPVVLGMALAAVTGLGLGAVLVRMTDQPLRVDWAAPAAAAGLGAALIARVTLLSMPALWRLMRPEGLHTE